MAQVSFGGKRISGTVKLCASLLCLVATAGLLVFSTGCGSSSSNKTMSPAQAQAVSQEFSTALQAALSASLSGSAQRGPRPGLATILKDAQPDQTSGCTANGNGESCNLPVSYSGACPGGGSIGISGDFAFTLDSSGDGSDDTTLTITPTNCSVSNETINGNPSVTVATQITFTNDAPVFPITLSETGGISFAPNPTGTCSVSVQYSVTENSCTATGTICGQSVSGSC